jgi:hypothetical protein
MAVDETSPLNGLLFVWQPYFGAFVQFLARFWDFVDLSLPLILTQIIPNLVDLTLA